MALLRFQEQCSLLRICSSHHPNPIKPPRNPRKNQLLPPNAAKNATPSEIPAPRAPAAARKAAILARKALVPVAAAVALWPLPSLAAEGDGKVSLESIVVAIDDFNNRNPFFVAGVVFVWLVVIPLVEEYFFKKYKPVSAIDAFRKLRDVPEAQLLDIRRTKSVRFMASPNLKLVDKSAVQVELDEEDEKGFVKEVLARFPDPANTVVCVLDKMRNAFTSTTVLLLLYHCFAICYTTVSEEDNFNRGKELCSFDGNSLKVAELLVKNGFKEAYAIKGGLRGPEGWQAVQENYLPPSVHVFPRKKKGAKLAHTNVSADGDGTDGEQEGNGEPLAPPNTIVVDAGHESKDVYENPNGSTIAAKLATRRPLSPYPNV
ncbi:Rhodanese-like domain-containing protein 4A, chloroplastic [Dichanthelium oligosanthes]|uniref:Rhodanese-like domain-containing protein 4A, chloroplastic n=1 Tax=Dichanthelium oligosanthes TaxID=888268 RepID=A0A1E5UJD9_9POAL|nr:Rhodanese-like domain-containing protein 4A, chloroplastic [Dichanthelium oligosanthes]